MSKKTYRVLKVETIYVVADDAADAETKGLKGWGIPMGPTTTAEEILPEEFFAAIDGLGNEEGGSYGPNGTAWFYNDEYFEPYRLNLETGHWEPLDGFGEDEDLNPDYYNADDVHNQGFADLKRGDEDGTWIDFMETNGR